MAKVKTNGLTKERGSRMQHQNQFKEGHVLLEAVVLLGILGIFLALIMPTYAQCIQRAEENVCQRNCQQLQKLYEVQLLIQDEVHSERLFEAFMEGQEGICCPEGGTIQYEEGIITCTRHDREAEYIK